MLTATLAKQFIKKISSNTKYDINIMNCKGYIIASTDVSRIGEYHEIAHEIIKKKKEIAVVDDDSFIGTCSGVNILLTDKEEVVGVLGIRGNPKEVLPFAGILKITIESMIELENLKDEKMHNVELSQRIFNLLFDTKLSNSNLKVHLEQLNYDSNIIRIPCLIEISSQVKSNKYLLMELQHQKYINYQDISLQYKNNSILILKALTKTEAANYKEECLQWFSAILRNTAISSSIHCAVFGLPQKRPSLYKESTYQISWLLQNNEIKSKIIFFSDHVDQYFKNFIDFKELYTIFDLYKSNIKIRNFSNYIHTFEVYLSSYGNLNETSRLLNLHRNTVLSHLNKLNELFHIDIIKNYSDAIFLNYFIHYYKLTNQNNIKE